MARNAGQAAQPISPQQELNDAYSDLLDDLNEAYWAAGSLNTKDQIKGFIDAVTDVVTALDAADLSSRDAAYNELNTQVKGINNQLQTLQKQINGIISRINTAASIVSNISTVVSVAGRVFPAV